MAGAVTPLKNLHRFTNPLKAAVSSFDFTPEIGSVDKISAGQITVSLGDVAIGELCHVRDHTTGSDLKAQVVAIGKNTAVLAPIEPLEGLTAAAEVVASGQTFEIGVGDHLIGRALDGLGKPIDGLPLPKQAARRPIMGRGVSPFERLVIDERFHTGIRAIDLFNSVGMGQRMAILGEPGSGKSSLLGMLASNTDCDAVVLAMIGERGREVREFLERQVPDEVRSRCVAVVATSERPAMERVLAAHAAMAIAEDLRDRGKNVLLLFDSVTRFARALREVGLAAGEQAVRQGFTPSVYEELPKLIERSGKTATGSITGFFTVLLENEGVNDAISEEVMSLTDGHLRLSPKMASAGHYPAIDVLASKSRLMREIAPESVSQRASQLRGLMAKYLEIELLVQVGEYAPGSDLEADQAVAAKPGISALIRQTSEEAAPFEDAVMRMEAIIDDLETPAGGEASAA